MHSYQVNIFVNGIMAWLLSKHEHNAYASCKFKEYPEQVKDAITICRTWFTDSSQVRELRYVRRTLIITWKLKERFYRNVIGLILML